MHNLYQLSKTLRFELKPVGKTKEFFEKLILENDEKKAIAYPYVKKYCDEVHKNFISECLENIDTAIFESELENYFNIVSQTDIDIEALKDVKDKL